MHGLIDVYRDVCSYEINRELPLLAHSGHSGSTVHYVKLTDNHFMMAWRTGDSENGKK